MVHGRLTVIAVSMLRRLASLAVALTLVLGLVIVGSPTRAWADGGERIELVQVLHVATSGVGSDPGDVHSIPLGQSIDLLADCKNGETPPECGNPAASWAAQTRPVQVCTIQTGRPSWMTAVQFQQAVRDATLAWNKAEAPLGVMYGGDCAAGSVEQSGDGRNEIGFMDGPVVPGGDAATTKSSIIRQPAVNPTVRTIVEADVYIPNGFPQNLTCFQHAVTHEVGHVLGLGHSTTSADVMYPTIDFANATFCHPNPTMAELARLQDVYGINRTPTVGVGGALTAQVGDTVSLAGTASDPENDLMTFAWTQTSGPTAGALAGATTLASNFVASSPGVYVFTLTATDRYLHQGSASVTVTVAGSATGGTAGVSTLPASGFGLFVFTGGSTQRLIDVTGCPPTTAAFWVTDGQGSFVIYVPGTTITAVNQRWLSMFPQGLPANTAVLGRCR